MIPGAGIALAALLIVGAAYAQSDSEAPTFSAELASATEVRILFSEAVSGATEAGDWSVAGSTVHSVRPASLSGGTELTLRLLDARPLTSLEDPDGDGPAAALTNAGITYTPPAAGALTDGGDNGLGTANTPVAASSVLDKAVPNFDTVEFKGATSIEIATSEDVAAPVQSSFTVAAQPPASGTLAVTAVTLGAGADTITLSVESAAEGVTYEISGTITDTATPQANMNAASAAATYDTTPPSLTNPRFTSANTIAIDVNERIMPVSSLNFIVSLAGGATQALGTVEASHTNNARTATIVLTTQNDADPAASYSITYPAGIADMLGNAAKQGGSASFSGTDAVAPSFEAELTSSETVRIVFDEPVTGTTTASEWTVTGSLVGSVLPARLNGDTDLTLGLVVPRSLTNLEDPDGPGSATALTASGVAYTRPPADGNVIADAASNALAAAPGDRVEASSVSDRAPPTFVARTWSAAEIDIIFSEKIHNSDSAAYKDPSHWTAIRSAPASVESLNTTSLARPYVPSDAPHAFTVYMLTVDESNMFATDANPEVSYVRPAANYLADASYAQLADDPRHNAVEATPAGRYVAADDGAAPVLGTPRFTAADTIVVGVSEEIADPANLAFTVTEASDSGANLAISTLTYSDSSDTITLTTSGDSVVANEYTLNYPPGITDARGNAAAGGALVIADLGAPEISTANTPTHPSSSTQLRTGVALLTPDPDGFSVGGSPVTFTYIPGTESNPRTLLELHHFGLRTVADTTYILRYPDLVAAFTGAKLPAGTLAFTVRDDSFLTVSNPVFTPERTLTLDLSYDIAGTNGEFSVYAGSPATSLDPIAYEFDIHTNKLELFPSKPPVHDTTYTISVPEFATFHTTPLSVALVLEDAATYTDTAQPTLSNARFTAADTITIDVDDSITDVAGLDFVVARAGQSSQALISVTASRTNDPVTDTAVITLVTGQNAADETDYDVIYPTITDTQNNAAEPGVFEDLNRGDNTPPTFAVELRSSTEIRINFSELVSGTIDGRHWGVAGHEIESISPAAATPRAPVMALTLTLADRRATDLGTAPALSPAAVTYTPPAAGGLADAAGLAFGPAGTPVAASALADRAPPELRAEFTSANRIVVGLSEEIVDSGSLEFTVELASSRGTNLGTVTYAYTASPSQITLQTATDAAPNAMYLVTHTAIPDRQSNQRPPGAIPAAYDTVELALSNPTFTSATTIEITANEEITDPGNLAFAVRLASESGSNLGTVSYSYSSADNTFTLTTAEGASDNTAYVIEYPPISDAHGIQYPGGDLPVTSGNIAPARLSDAEFTSPNTITLKVSEDIEGLSGIEFTVTETDDGTKNLGVIGHRYYAPARTITLTTTESAVAARDYTLNYPAGITDTTGNETPAGSLGIVDLGAPRLSIDRLVDGVRDELVIRVDVRINPVNAGLFMINGAAPESVRVVPATSSTQFVISPSENFRTGVEHRLAHPPLVASDTGATRPAGTFTFVPTTDSPLPGNFAFTPDAAITMDLNTKLTSIDGAFSVYAGSPGASLDPIRHEYYADSDMIVLYPSKRPASGTSYTVDVPGLTGLTARTSAAATFEDAATYTDTRAPQFRAELESTTEVRIVFDEPVTGATAASDWSINGVAPGSLSTAIAPGSPGTEIVLVLADSDALGHTSLAQFDSSGAPYTLEAADITYTRPASGALADGVSLTLGAAPGSEVAATALEDEAPPVIRSASFTDANTIAIELSEDVAVPSGFASATLGTLTQSYASGGGSYTITLATATAAIDGTSHTIARPALIDLVPPPPNVLRAGDLLVKYDASPTTFEAELRSADTVRIVFSETVAGVTAPGDWSVAGSEVESLSATSLLGTELTLTLAEPRPLTSLDDPDGAGPELALTPSAVAYTRPSVGSNTIADGVGNDLAASRGDTVTAAAVADRAPPTFTARTASTAEIDVIFTELVHNSQNDLFRNAAHWTVDGTAPTAVTSVNTTSAVRPYTDSGMGGTHTVYTLTAGTLAPGDTPQIRYVRPASNYLADALVTAGDGSDGGGDVDGNNAVSGASVNAAAKLGDTAPPALSDARFVAPDRIAIDVDDQIRDVSSLAFTVALAGQSTPALDMVEASRTNDPVTYTATITLRTAEAAADNTVYDIGYPAVSDILGNEAAPGTLRNVSSMDIVPPVLSNARFTSGNTIEIDVDDQINPVSSLAFIVSLSGEGTQALGSVAASRTNDPAENTAVIELRTVGTAADNTVYDIHYPAVSDTNGNPAAPAALEGISSGDDTAPALSNARFTSADTIEIDVADQIRDVSSLAFTVALAGQSTPALGMVEASRTNDPAQNTAVIVLRTTTAAADNTVYDIGYPALTDLRGTAGTDGTFDDINSGDDAAPALSNARFTSTNTIEIDVDDQIEDVSSLVFTVSPDGQSTQDLGDVEASRTNDPAADTAVITLRTQNAAADDTVYDIGYPALTDLRGAAGTGGTLETAGTGDITPPVLSSPMFIADDRTLQFLLSEPLPSGVLTPQFTITPEVRGPITTFHVNINAKFGPHIRMAFQGDPVTEGVLYTVTYPPITDVAGNSNEGGTFTNIEYDKTPPVLSNPRFTDLSTIAIDVNDQIEDVASLRFTVMRAGETEPAVESVTPSRTNNPGTNLATILLGVGTGLDGNVYYDIGYPAITDTDGNAADLGTFRNVRSIDFTAPALTNPQFVAANRITIDVDGQIQAVPPRGFTVTLAGESDDALGAVEASRTNHPFTNTATITLTTENDARDDTSYDITYPTIRSTGTGFSFPNTLSDVTYSDLTPPRLLLARFTDSNTVTIDVDDQIRDVASLSFSVARTGAPADALSVISAARTNDQAANTALITLRTQNAAADNTPYNIRYPVITDTSGNTGTMGTFVGINSDDVTAPVLSGARFAAADTIEITVSEDIVDPGSLVFAVRSAGAAPVDLGPVTYEYSAVEDKLTLTTTKKAADSTSYTVSHPAISDAGGNELAAGSLTALTGDVTPPALSNARFADANTIKIDADDQIRDVASLEFFVARAGETAQALGTVTPERANDQAANTAVITLRTQNAAPENLFFDVRHPAITDTAGNALAAGVIGSINSMDSTAPVLSGAAFTAADTIEITASEDIVDPGSLVFAVRSAGAAPVDLGPVTYEYSAVEDKFTLTTTTKAADSTRYTVSHPAISDAGGNELAAGSLTAVTGDVTPPALSNARFTAPNVITIDVDDQIPDVGSLEFKVTLAGLEDNALGTVMPGRTNDRAANTAVIALRTQNNAAAGTDYDVRYPAISDTDGNTAAEGVLEDVNPDAYLNSLDVTPPIFSARTSTQTEIVVTFSEDVYGTTAHTEWGVAGNTVRTVAPTGLSETSTLTLTLGSAIDTDGRPFVTYAKPGTGGNSIADAESGGNLLASRSVIPSDGVAPVFTGASFDGGTTIKVAVSEDVGVPLAVASFSVAETDAPANTLSVTGTPAFDA